MACDPDAIRVTTKWLRGVGLLVLFLVTLLAVPGLGNLRFNSHYSVYLDADDPRLLEQQAIAKTFARGDNVLVMLVSEDDTFVSADLFELLEDLTSRLSALEHVRSVISISELGIAGESETADGALVPTMQQLREHGRAIGLLISADGRLAAINIDFELPDRQAGTVLSALKLIRGAVEADLAGRSVTVHYTGTLALNEAYISVVRHDLAVILPLLLLVMIVVPAFFLRSARAVFVALPVGVGAVLAGFGLAGWLQAELAAVNTFVPVIILSISLAGCMHMALSFARYRAAGEVPDEAACSAVRFNLLPMTLANATTALGFLGLLLSPSPPIRVVGYVTAAGVATSFVLCMTLLPALQARFDPASPRARTDSLMGAAWVNIAGRPRRALLVGTLLLALPATWLLSRNVISDNLLEYFPPSHPFHRDTALVEHRLSGVSEVLYSLDTGAPNGLFEAAAIELVDEFGRWLQRQPEVVRVTAVSDARQLAEAREAGRLQDRLMFYRQLVDDRRGVGPLIAREVSADYAATAVVAYLHRLDSAALVAFDRRVRDWAAVNLSALELTGGGPVLMFAYLGEQNVRSMLFALSAALLLAAVVLGAVLRSARMAVVGLICNILPVLLVYSVWAVVKGRISLGAAVVMGMILGIVIDDTIYLLTTYRRARARNLADPVLHTLQRVGPALVVTTVTLVASLSLGLLSDFEPIWSMSLLSVAIIALALAVDLLLLPAMLTSPERSSRRD
jgi:predicted RND superfamily exporter protein